MEPHPVVKLLGLAPLALIPLFYKLSPASKSTKVWTTFYLCIFASYVYFPETARAFIASVRDLIVNEPAKAAVIAVTVGVPLKYLQYKLRFGRINAIKMKYGFTEDPATYEDMTIEQAQEIESNMAEVSLSQATSTICLILATPNLGTCPGVILSLANLCLVSG